MLVEKAYKVNDIVTMALNSGQEVLGKLVREDEENFVLLRPLTIAFGQQGAAFQPFTMTGDSEGEVSFMKDKVVAVLKTNKETTDGYRQATTGLVVPEKSGLIT
jgi:hypothetical protein